jgi:hypothetical protein
MLRKGEGGTMPWVVRDAIDDINRAVGRRWQGLDRLLPGPADLPEGCAAPLVASGANGRPAWSYRMGYRPLWTGWEVRPAASLRKAA